MLRSLKYRALLLAASLSLACLAGCGGAPAPSASAPPSPVEERELYTISILGSPRVGKSSAEHAVGQYIKEKFNLVFEYIPYSGDQREKENMLLAAGDYNELQNLQGDDIVYNYISAGALLDFDRYLDSMPDFAARYRDTIPYWRLVGDGKLYKYETYLPAQLATDFDTNDLLVRTDVLEQQGWPNPDSASAWVAFLKQALRDNPEVDGLPVVGLTVPFAESWGLRGISCTFVEKSEFYSAPDNDAVLYNLKTKQFEDYLSNPYAQETLRFFNTLYREGLLDEECFTDTLDRSMEKLATGRALAAWHITFAAPYSNQALAQSGKEHMQYVRLPIRSDTSVQNGEKRQLRIRTTYPVDSWGVTKNCRHPERLMELFNWIASDEGQILLRSGLEGVHWERRDGKRVFTDTGLRASTDPEFNNSQGLNEMRFLPWFNLEAADGQPHDLALQSDYKEQVSLTDRQRQAFQQLGWSSSTSWYLDHGWLAETGLSSAITVDPASDIGKSAQKLAETRVKYSAKMIMAGSAEEFESAYAEALAEYNRLDPQRVVAEYNRLLAEKQKQLEFYRSDP